MFFMAQTIDTSIPQFGFQASLLHLTAATAEAAGATVLTAQVNHWKQEAREVESLVAKYVRPRAA